MKKVKTQSIHLATIYRSSDTLPIQLSSNLATNNKIKNITRFNRKTGTIEGVSLTSQLFSKIQCMLLRKNFQDRIVSSLKRSFTQSVKHYTARSTATMKNNNIHFKNIQPPAITDTLVHKVIHKIQKLNTKINTFNYKANIDTINKILKTKKIPKSKHKYNQTLVKCNIA